MRAIVTGGAGFIGSHLVDYLVNQKAEVIVVDDLSRGKIENLYKSIEEIEFIQHDLSKRSRALESIKNADICFHLASLVGGVLKMSTNQAMSSIIPVVDRNVLDACVLNGIPSFLYTSTACAYPVTLQDEAHENYFLREDDVLPAHPESVYGWAKLFGEQVATRYHKEHGLHVAIVRDFNVYGTREDTNPETSHVIPALVKRAVERQDPYVVWGTGRQSRSFVHVSDVIEGMYLAGMKIKDATPINLGTEERIKISRLANLILEVSGFKPQQVVFNHEMPMGVFTRAPDALRAHDLLGWSPKVALKDGIGEMVEWYRGKAET